MSNTKKVYDYLVLGGGSGGIASARRAAMYGAKVAVIEQGRLGGTCVNVGCVPKKVMWNTASIAEALQDAAAYGFDIKNKPHFSWNLVKKKRDAYIERLNGIYGNNLGKDSIDIIKGTATFVDSSTVRVGDDFYGGNHILIATGSRAWIPNVPGAAEFGMTSDGFFEIEEMPSRVAIAGAGYIAVELAGIFKTLGAEVTLFIRQAEFLRSFDSCIREGVMQSYLDMGIEIVSCSSISKVENLSSNPLQKKLSLSITNKDTLETSIKDGYEALIWAVGREANTHSLNIKSTGVKLNQQGFIITDEYQNTGVPNLYSLGDIGGIEMLTPVAIAAGRRLSERLFNNKPDSKLDYSLIPSVIFSHPTAGSIGLSEQAAIQKYGKDQIKVYQSKFVNMYFSMMEHKQKTHYKIVCHGPEEKVIGLHLFGRGSDEILQGFGVAMKMGATKSDFDSCVAIHPTAAEELVTMR